MKSCIRSLAFVALASATAGAFAQERAPRTLGDALVASGMTKVDEGLYAKVSDSDDAHSQSYVAVGAAGQRALLSELIALRAAHSGDDGSADSKAALMESVDELIATLSDTKAATRVVLDGGPGGGRGPYRGDCNGVDQTNNESDPFYLQALAGGGPTGLGGASAGVWNANPALYTTNVAKAKAIDAVGDPIHEQQVVTTYGTASAVASQLYANGCAGVSSATITCPGHTQPSISALAYGFRNRPGCNN